jgi:hypothetical protein
LFQHFVKGEAVVADHKRKKRLAGQQARCEVEQAGGGLIGLADDAGRRGHQVRVGGELEQVGVARAFGLDDLARPGQFLVLDAQLLVSDAQLFERGLQFLEKRGGRRPKRVAAARGPSCFLFRLFCSRGRESLSGAAVFVSCDFFPREGGDEPRARARARFARILRHGRYFSRMASVLPVY